METITTLTEVLLPMLILGILFGAINYLIVVRHNRKRERLYRIHREIMEDDEVTIRTPCTIDSIPEALSLIEELCLSALDYASNRGLSYDGVRLFVNPTFADRAGLKDWVFVNKYQISLSVVRCDTISETETGDEFSTTVYIGDPHWPK